MQTDVIWQSHQPEMVQGNRQIYITLLENRTDEHGQHIGLCSAGVVQPTPKFGILEAMEDGDGFGQTQKAIPGLRQERHHK